MKMRIAIHQTYRVERRIVTEIDAAATEGAYEISASGEIDVPPFNNPRWSDLHALEHEEYRPA